MRTKNSIRNAIFGTIRYLLQIIFKFITRTFIILYLGEKFVGVDSLFSSILQILSLAELGFGSALVFSMYKPIADNDVEKVSILMHLYKKVYNIVALLVLILGLCLMPFLGYFVKDGVPDSINIYWVFGIYLLNSVFGYLLSYKRSLIYAYQRNDIESKVCSITMILLNGIQILLIYLTRNYYAYIVLFPIFTIIENLIIYIVADKIFKLPKTDKKLTDEEKKEISKKIKAMIYHKIGSVVVFSTDNLLISTFIGLTISGRYNNYYLVISSFITLLNVFTKSITASLGNSIVKEDVNKNLSIFYKITILNFIFLGVTITGLVGCFQRFILVWLKNEEYLFSFDIVLLIVLSYFITGLRTNISIFREVTGTFYNDRYKPIIESVVNFVVSIVLVHYIGLSGIIIGTVASSLLVALPIEIYVVFKHYFQTGFKKYFYYLIKYTLLIIALCVGIYYLNELMPISGIWGFIMMGFISVALSSLMICIFSIKDPNFLYFKNFVFDRLFSKRKEH